MLVVEILFWASLGLLAWTHLLYPLSAQLLAKVRTRPVAKDAESLPTVTVIVAAYNEAAVIERRIENLAGWLVAPPLFVSGQSLVDLADESVFNGFDEIWVPGDGPLPDAAPRLCLSSPPHFVGGAPGEASNVLAGGRWRLGLGDGDGLNFVASDLAAFVTATTPWVMPCPESPVAT